MLRKARDIPIQQGIAIFRTTGVGSLDPLRLQVIRLFVGFGRVWCGSLFQPANPEAHKRRSTRIVQAVPLTVTGVDALGRPFQERTSTLIINCHGCRYQSKHYVLKNMWVTLEVPHPESGHAARTVRGRVMWILRPRTVRELFQVGVELEVAGNFWGIAFPPTDWFAFPEGLAAVPSPPVSAKPSAPPAQDHWPTPPDSGSGSTEHDVHVLALAPGVESSAASQVSQLVDEAKQELRAAVRQSAAEAVSLEARPLIASLELQLKSAAEKSLAAAAGPAAEKAFQDAKKTQVDAFLQECSRSMSQNMERVVQQLASRLERNSNGERGAAFEQQIEKRIQESLEQLQKQAADLPVPMPPANAAIGMQIESALIPSVQELEQRIRAQVEQAHASLSEIENAAGRLQEQTAAAITSGQSDWQARVEADLIAATDRWNQQIESSVENATRQAGERVARNAQLAGEQAERDLTLRIGEVSKAFDGVAKDSESRLDGLRALPVAHENERAQESLRQLQSVENRIEDQAAKLNGLSQAAEQALDRAARHCLAGGPKPGDGAACGSGHCRVGRAPAARAGSHGPADRDPACRPDQG